MRCEDCRDAISARLDGEDRAGEDAVIDAHLEGCPSCRTYAERSAHVTRLARTGLAETPPDLVAAVLAAVPPVRRRRRTVAVRVALGAVGVGQCAVAVSGVVAAGGAAHHGAIALAGASTAHFAHESSAWNLALGVGFLWAAVARTRMPGLIPVIGSFLAVLAGLSAVDLLAGRVDPARLLTHGLVALGLALLVARAKPGAGDGGGAASTPAGDVEPSDRSFSPIRARTHPAGGGDGIRPTARRPAA